MNRSIFTPYVSYNLGSVSLQTELWSQKSTIQRMKGWWMGDENKKIGGASGVLERNPVLLLTSVALFFYDPHSL